MDMFEPVIVSFCCHYCAYTAADMAGTQKIAYPPNLRIVKVPCAGTVDITHLLRAVEKGADGVCVMGCLEGDCHFREGNLRAVKRVNYVKKVLEELGMETERVELFMLSAGMGDRFAAIAREFTEKIRELGPSPLKTQGERAA